MMDFDIKALADMLQTEQTSDDEELDDEPQSVYAKLNPGDIGPKTTNESTQSNTKVKKNPDLIWDEEEVNTGAEYDDSYDPRLQPEYDIMYKQAVTSEDMFLGMGNKTPATSSCEKMVVKIKLPETKLPDVQLDVKEKFLDCRTPKL